jgi:hypothetical protein
VANDAQPIAPLAAQPKVVILQPQPIAKTAIESWLPYLPLVVTLVGWAVINGQNNRRERRKELRDLIRQVEQRVDSILDNAASYFALDGSALASRELEHKIRSGFSGTSQLLSRLKAAGWNHKTQEEFIAFKQAVTGGQFESTSRKKSDASGALLAESATAGFAFVSKLEENYFSTFPVRMKPFWKFWQA